MDEAKKLARKEARKKARKARKKLKKEEQDKRIKELLAHPPKHNTRVGHYRVGKSLHHFPDPVPWVKKEFEDQFRVSTPKKEENKIIFLKKKKKKTSIIRKTS